MLTSSGEKRTPSSNEKMVKENSSPLAHPGYLSSPIEQPKQTRALGQMTPTQLKQMQIVGHQQIVAQQAVSVHAEPQHHMQRPPLARTQLRKPFTSNN
jgi:hypothetical protein